MAEGTNAEAMLEFWKRQVQEGTKAWLDAIGRGQPADPAAVWRPFVDQSIAAWAAVMGQGPVSPDLTAQWRQFLNEWIAAWGEALEQAMHSEAFAAALGRSLDQWVSAQAPVRKAAAEVSATALEALGLPSRQDLEALSQLTGDLDDRLERVEDQLKAMASGLSRSRPQAAAAPPRTRAVSASAARPQRRRPSPRSRTGRKGRR